jgi:hypothetical protein
MPQLQHNMWVGAARSTVLSVITGGGKWVEIVTHANPLYQLLIVTASASSWRCVETGEPPRLFGVEPPKPRIEAVRIVNMSVRLLPLTAPGTRLKLQEIILRSTLLTFRRYARIVSAPSVILETALRQRAPRAIFQVHRGNLRVPPHTSRAGTMDLQLLTRVIVLILFRTQGCNQKSYMHLRIV